MPITGMPYHVMSAFPSRLQAHPILQFDLPACILMAIKFIKKETSFS